MPKPVTSSLAALGIAAAFVLPPSYAAQAWSGRDRAERSELSPSQNVDRADAAIASFKADLRLSDDQAKNWPGLQNALHDIAADRAKTVADNDRNGQSGRSAADANGTAPAPAANQAAAPQDQTRPDDIAMLRRRADALAAESNELKKIADAGQPLYDSLNDHQREQFVRFVNYFSKSSEADDWTR